MSAVFVTVGTTQHDDLIAAVTSAPVAAVLKARGFARVTCQIGTGALPFIAAAGPTAAALSSRDEAALESLDESDAPLPASRGATDGVNAGAGADPKPEPERPAAAAGAGTGAEGQVGYEGGASAGSVTVRCRGLEWQVMRFTTAIVEEMRVAQLIISHGGTYMCWFSVLCVACYAIAPEVTGSVTSTRSGCLASRCLALTGPALRLCL